MKHSQQLFDSIAASRPVPQMMLGILCVVGGAGGAWSFRQLDVVCTLFLAPALAGLFFIANGHLRLRDQRRLEVQVRRIQEGGERLLDELVGVHARRDNLVRYLTEQGFSDLRLRQLLIKLTKRRAAGFRVTIPGGSGATR